MKKMAIVLGILIVASPALAGVDITATHEGGGVVRIDYASDANVSAFALEVTVDNGVISNVTDYHVGDCNATKKGYGIFPANFHRYINPNSPNWNDPCYTPVADPCDPGAAGSGFNKNKVILEMGALYEDGNQPGLSGTLCRVTCSADCNLSVVANALRGKVVLTDFNDVDPNVASATNIPVVTECFPSCHPDYAEWVAVGKPDSWCYPRQCHGDADGQTEQPGKVVYWVGYNDLTVFINCWQDKLGLPASLPADFDHDTEQPGKVVYRVGYNDLYIFIDNWQDKLGSPPDCLDCP